MCWMTIRRGADPLPEAVEAIRRHEDMNGHAWGWAVAHGGELMVEKGLGKCPAEPVGMPVGEAALAHVRFATRGGHVEENAHPFVVERGGEAVAALAHNGTWREAPDVADWSDTRVMAEVLRLTLEENPGMPFGRAFRALGERTGETLVALHRDGTCWVHAGRFPITRDGDVVASSGHGQLAPGVHVIEPSAKPAGGGEVPADD